MARSPADLRVLGCALALAAAWLTSSEHARADPADDHAKAAEHYEAALRHFATQQYEVAIAEFKAGYVLNPRPDILYAIAQAERLGGHCDRAVDAYGAFLRTHPPPAEAALARENLAKCAELLAQQRAAAERAPTSARRASKPVADHAADPPSSSPPFYTDVLGDLLVGVGIAGLGTGVALWIVSESHASSANDATTLQSYEDARATALSARTGAWISAGAGAALTLAGIIRYATRPTGRVALEDDRPHVAPCYLHGAQPIVAAAPGFVWIGFRTAR